MTEAFSELTVNPNQINQIRKVSPRQKKPSPGHHTSLMEKDSDDEEVGDGMEYGNY